VTDLPAQPSPKRLGLVIDLDTCVGCHACATNCKEWNTGGKSGPLTDINAYQAEQRGVWFNRVHTYEAGDGAAGRTVHFPKNCLHCAEPACVTVCPTGASYKRAEDGIVLIDHDKCIGCKLCSWACPYGAREFDEDQGVMKKCTLCIDKIYNETLPEEERVPACVSTCPVGARHFGDFNDPASNVSTLTRERGGYDLMPNLGYAPTSKYVPPREGRGACGKHDAPAPKLAREPRGFLRLLDQVLSR
jgi:Fe-S-cluster-containing dehydrogenase component